MNPQEKQKRKNPLEVAFRRGEQEANTNKYAEELSQKSFYEAARLEFLIAGIASYGANFVSVLTAFSFALIGLATLLPEVLPTVARYTLSGGVAFGTLLMLEVVKRANTAAFFRKQYIARKANVKNTIALVALSAFSVILSVLGAADLARMATDERESIADQRAAAIAGVQTQAQSKVDALELEIKAIEKRTDQQIADRMFLTYPEAVTKTIEGKRQEQAAIREDAALQISEVEKQFVGDSMTNEERSRKALYFMLGASLIAETLAILCLWFRVYYKYKVVSQRELKNAPQVTAEPAKEERVLKVERVNATQNAQNAPETRKSVRGGASHDVDDRIMGIQKSGWKREIRPCEKCGSDFTKKTVHHKFCSSACKNAYHRELKES